MSCDYEIYCEISGDMSCALLSGGGSVINNGGAGGGGGNGTNDTVNCDIRNGGCEHICVRGKNGEFDYCSCFTGGYYLSLNERDCLGEFSLLSSHSLGIFTNVMSL